MEDVKLNKPIVLSIIVLLIATIGYILCLKTIDAGEIGVITTFGKVGDGTLDPGLHLINPFSIVHVINRRVQTIKVDSQAASNDMQNVNTQLTLNYSISTANPQMFYSNLGSDADNLSNNIISPAVSEAFKSVVAQFTAENLIEKRGVVSTQISSAIALRLKKYDIMVSSISVTDFKFSQVYEDAIEAKATAQQNALKAQNDLQRIQIEAQQKIVQANATAQAMQSQKAVVTPELIQLKQMENETKAIEKWDGKLPQYVGSNIPFIKSINN